ncbi:MAG TPA: 8-amino-7-oxononanoate synthase [Nitrospirae bacterium]|nr:8-amino-7-oxononanoate synthase [Nitrospirota bacterium]
MKEFRVGQNTPTPTALLREAKQWGDELKKLRAERLLRKLYTIDLSSNSRARVLIKGQNYINFSSNDYLGLAGHPDITKAAVKALNKYGLGSGASRLLSGTYSPHKKLEARLARFKRAESALVFNTGYSANTGIIPAIAGRDAVIFGDELNHASIVDGARLARAKVQLYRHRDMDHLESLLKKCHQKKLIITDTVFSMDGDIAPLKDIVFLRGKYRAFLMIDDAHATGVLGKKARGGLEHFNIRADGIIQMGTLSKAVGCFGGYAAGSKALIDFLINRARSFIYSTSFPPAIAEAAIKAIDIVDSGSQKRREKLWKNRHRLFQGLNVLGFDTLDSETPIIPLFLGDVKRTLKISRYLYNEKIFAPAIRPPTVAKGQCRIRFSVTSAHTYKDIDTVLDSLRRFRDQ